MKIEVEIEAEDWVPQSLLDSMDMVTYYIRCHGDAMGGESDEWHRRCYNESVRDYNAMAHVYNYYTPAEKHITTRYEEMD